MNAETFLAKPVKQSDRIASMGPRSHERGNADILRLGELEGILLQWGRVLMNAETAGRRRDAYEDVSERQAPRGKLSRHRRKNCVSGNQAQTLARERVTRQPPTLDCGSTLFWL